MKNLIIRYVKKEQESKTQKRPVFGCVYYYTGKYKPHDGVKECSRRAKND